jgi:hypothetical protein
VQRCRDLPFTRNHLSLYSDECTSLTEAQGVWEKGGHSIKTNTYSGHWP